MNIEEIRKELLEDLKKPEWIRVTADGPVYVYTYPEQDDTIPKGYRRVTYLETYEEENT